MVARPETYPLHGALADALAAELIHARYERQLSQYALARLSGCSRQVISLYEGRIRRPTLGALVALAPPLGLTLTALVARAERRVRRAEA
jgi:transcriptional regulator with XRE-family HTH domain